MPMFEELLNRAFSPISSTQGALVDEFIGNALAREGCFYSIIDLTTIAASGTLTFGWEVPSWSKDTLIFYSPQFATSGDFTCELREGATFSGGTVVTGVNRNRVSGSAPEGQFAIGPTVTDTGTRLYNFFIPSGNKLDDVNTSNITVINPADQLLLNITNLDSANAHTFCFYLAWYELT